MAPRSARHDVEHPQAGGESHAAAALKEKHAEFEAAAERFGVRQRTTEQNLHGVEQHVAHTSKGGLLRWPVSYEEGLPP